MGDGESPRISHRELIGRLLSGASFPIPHTSRAALLFHRYGWGLAIVARFPFVIRELRLDPGMRRGELSSARADTWCVTVGRKG